MLQCSKKKPIGPWFWSFEFGSLQIVSDFVLRISDFQILHMVLRSCRLKVHSSLASKKQGKNDHCRARGKTDEHERSKSISLVAVETGDVPGRRRFPSLQREISSPLLVPKLPPVQSPKEHNEADTESDDHVKDEIGIVQSRLFLPQQVAPSPLPSPPGWGRGRGEGEGT